MKMIVTKLGLGVGLALAMPGVAAAQTAPAPVAVLPAPDPARLAGARLVIEQIWPLGTYQRMMDAAFEEVVNTMFAGMYDVPVSSFAGMAGVDETEAARLAGGKTMRDLMLEADPHFEERMQITMRVMGKEMTPLMTEMEPGIRDSLAVTYARRFTAAQLADLHSFFETPSGKFYASESMMLMMSPEVMKAMQAFMPKLIEHMPAIMGKVQEATRHLPPVPIRQTGGAQ